MMLDRLTKTLFAENLQTIFTLQLTPTQTLELTLIELREGRSTPQQEQFALLFCGPIANPFWQGMWSMHHPTLGQLDLFLVPVGRGEEGLYYEAVFNRLLSFKPT